MSRESDLGNADLSQVNLSRADVSEAVLIGACRPSLWRVYISDRMSIVGCSLQGLARLSHRMWLAAVPLAVALIDP
jgi:uncharacterized protein YjbI with pentapeptide repeats